MKTKIHSVQEYINLHAKHEVELNELYQILHATELKETIKWNIPVFTCLNKNIVGLASFQAYVGLWFYQGALLADDEHVLHNANPEKTVALRQWRFQSIDDIQNQTDLITSYIAEAIDNEKQGHRIPIQKNKPLIIPKELNQFLKKNKELQSKFNSLTKSCKREYADYIAEAKRPETKQRRLQKISKYLQAGKSLNDKYRQ